MLRLVIISLCFFPLILTAQTTQIVHSELALARQAYHSQWQLVPQYAPPIADLLDSLHWRNEFSAFCPTDGGDAIIIRNNGKASQLSPPTTPNHPWEPIGWILKEDSVTWESKCPGDSVIFVYNPSSSRSSCGPEPDTPPWGSASSNSPDDWWIETVSELGVSNGSAYTRLGIDQSFDKPVIIVEGFDFGIGGNMEEHRHGNFGWESLFACNIDVFPGTLEYPILLDSLYSLGYDLVFIDFADGTHTIERKSKLVQRVIELCNSYKVSSNSLVLLGASMGGVVARHALCSMEQSGIEHCTRLYISIDAPHRGANISPGLVGLITLLSVPSSEAAIFYQGLNSSAAKQLVINSPNGAAIHSAAMEMLQNIGMPKKSVNLAIANSHPAVNLELENAPLLYWTESWWWLGTAHLLANRHPIGGNSLALSSSCALPVDFTPFNGTPIWYENETYSYYPEIDLDTEPSSLGRHMEALVSGINASGLLEISSDDYQPFCGFIPTSSALNCNIQEGENPSFDYISHSNSWNSPEEHVALSFLHRKMVLDHIILGDEIAPSELGQEADQTLFEYNNFEGVVKWIGSTDINSGGTIRIGGQGLFNDSISEVRTMLCDTKITVNAGGELFLGSPYEQGKGHLRISNNCELIGNDGGVINIYSGSRIVVEPGATLILDNMTLHIFSEATLEIQTGGFIHLRNNARILFEGVESELILKGEIQVEEGSNSKISSVNQSIFKISILGTTSKIKIKTGAELLIQGNNTIDFAENAHCHFNGDGILKIIDSEIHMSDNSIALQACKSNFKDINIYGTSSSTWKSTSKLRVEDSDWARVMLNIDSSNENSGIAGLISIHNNVDECIWNLENTGFKMIDNEFISVIFKSNHHLGPCQLINNLIEGTYGISGASVTISEGVESNVRISENRFLEGVTGLSIINSKATLSCNQFEGWDTAIHFKDKSIVYMNPLNGGGYNRFNSNRVHLELDESSIPLLDLGMNNFGSNGMYSISGHLNWDCNSTWTIQGNYWLNGDSSYNSGNNGTTNSFQVSSSLYTTNNECLGNVIDINVESPNPVITICPTGPTTEDDGKKKILVNSIFDSSGRIVNKQGGTGIYLKGQ
ncbi:MAG: hypothetical protein COA49_02080 [Bacteroidetes bacterium]|nr:MAG: hypothetical protein COA49_02080 [Bacteroidota bacterium]